MPDNFQFVCEQENVRLDVFLAEKLALTRTKVKDMIEQGHVLVNGKAAKPSFTVKKTMSIAGDIPEEEPLTLVAQDIPLEILYEDDYFLAINKQADMVVHPSVGHASGTLVNAVLAYLEKGKRSKVRGERSKDLEPISFGPGPDYHDTQHATPDSGTIRAERCLRFMAPNSEPGTPNSTAAAAALRPGIVHRLDKGTTGVILIAKDSKTQEMLSGMFKERQMKKTYRAIVEGVPRSAEWRETGNIGRHPVERKKMAVLTHGGRTAQTDFRLLKKLKDFAYVEAYPKTGRTHQIRVHLAHAGNPVVGDEAYGRRAKKSADRPLLHAYRIEFNHPVTRSAIDIIAPVPSDMIEFVRVNEAG